MQLMQNWPFTSLYAQCWYCLNSHIISIENNSAGFRTDVIMLTCYLISVLVLELIQRMQVQALTSQNIKLVETALFAVAVCQNL